MNSLLEENPLRTQVREASEADLPRLAELYFQLSQLGEIPDGERHPFAGEERRALQELAALPNSSCFVLEVDGRVEGSLCLYILPNVSHRGRPFAIVESVVVDEQARSKGFGRLLMDHAEALARAAGCYKIALTSNRKRDNAHRFYTGLGYRPTHQGFTKYFDLL